MSSCVGEHLTLQVHTKLKISQEFSEETISSNYLWHCYTAYLFLIFFLHFLLLYRLEHLSNMNDAALKFSEVQKIFFLTFFD